MGRSKTKYKRSSLERQFAYWLRLLAPDLEETMEEEYRFHPTRKWRFDYAWPKYKVAVGCEGGLFRRGGGAHRSVRGILRDIEKINAATLLGWRVLRVTVKHLENDPVSFFATLHTLITSRETALYPANTADTPQERAGVAGWMLCMGVPIPVPELAERLGTTTRATRSLLRRLARVLPIYELTRDTWHRLEG